MNEQGKNDKACWLLAGWPGMGSVAVGACAHIISSLEAKMVAELPAQDHFDLQQIEVKGGMVQPPRLPRCMLYRWENPSDGPNLLIFLAEGQATYGQYAFCHKLLEYVKPQNVSRVITFASLATQLHPSANPSVFAVCTDEGLLDELKRLEAKVLEEGQIGGMNGVLLAAASARKIPAACLMGEIPFFAAGVPNPKAGKSVIEVFSVLSGISIPVGELAKQAHTVDKALLDLLHKLQEAARQNAEEGDDVSTPFDIPAPDEENSESDELGGVDAGARARIESLFDAAEHDRSRAVELKELLDRLGAFGEYEDRFLDLFKRGE